MMTDGATEDRKSGEFTVLIASRNLDCIKQIDNVISQIDTLTINHNHICNGHSDPLYGLTELPDLLILWVGEKWKLELSELMSRPSAQRPALIICADNDDPQLMRMAIKAGAIDYLKPPIVSDELTAIVYSALNECQEEPTEKSGAVIALINAKGGSGASFIACNIADLMTQSSRLDVALMGMDIQFGSLSSYLDMDVKYGLIDALDNIDEMDSDALKGYMTQHSSGIDLLDAKPGELISTEEVEVEHLSRLLKLLTRNYDQVIVDLPRQINSLTSEVIDSADKILVVLQQSIAHIHDTLRLLEILQRDLAIPSDRITMVINRYDKRSDLTLDSISKTLNHQTFITIPNSFDEVSKSIDGGEPLSACFKRTTVTKALSSITDHILGQDSKTKSAVLNRVMKHFKVL